MDLEVELDRFLKIKTNGRDDSNSNFINYPYEATPYIVLQKLANSGHITKRDKIIDYGCGKGRVSFFLAYSLKAKMIGVEYDERLYNSALENHKKALSSVRVTFKKCNASDYIVAEDVNGAYFFNPFSIVVLRDVINNLRNSKAKNNREIKLFFYYISDDYLLYLLEEGIELIDEIDCNEYFNEHSTRECIKVFKL